ncbi:universal stress protein [Zunongwangia endophytica]|uniref:Universal stress protein n=1 Tax=Zunongwangia endophytica TaxID=1808945 RepID=A0ABV8HA12_9FLAO|nr:universal stress protein [Zunongwangia endophytica]MDN3593896.1 universal stress protein [Zunongwangia endophytica]
MKKVLIALDYHPNSEVVATTGYDLAKKMKAEVCLLHVLAEVSHYGVNYSEFLGYPGYQNMGFDLGVTTQLQEMAEDYLKTAKKQFNDDNVSTALEIGDSAYGILKKAEEWGADLIVMGTHSHSTIEKVLVGTVASKVLEKTNVPVYMIPIKK